MRSVVLTHSLWLSEFWSEGERRPQQRYRDPLSYLSILCVRSQDGRADGYQATTHRLHTPLLPYSGGVLLQGPAADDCVPAPRKGLDRAKRGQGCATQGLQNRAFPSRRRARTASPLGGTVGCRCCLHSNTDHSPAAGCKLTCRCDTCPIWVRFHLQPTGPKRTAGYGPFSWPATNP
jgi:hypothetical protein